MKKEELYISITPSTYRTNKSKILLNKIDILQILKRLQNLKVLARQKHDLKKELYKLLSSSLSQVDSLQEKMPTPKMPKAVQRKETIETKQVAIPSRHNEIEEELIQIQAKLQELNA